MNYQNKMVLYSALYIAFPISVIILLYSFFVPDFNRTILYLILGFQVLLLSVSIRVIGRFDRQSGKLERAAKRIAGGDLDYFLTTTKEDEFSGLIRSLEQMRLSLKEEQSKRFRFLMAVSHDLNTPLTSIIGYIEALQDGVAEDPEMQKRYFGIVREKAGLLESRIQELIEYVKTETGDWRLQAERIDACHFFNRLAATCRNDSDIMKREFEFRMNLPEESYILADETLLMRVFENLFSNAIRYSKEGDRIILDVQFKGKALEVRVEDTGLGIEQEKLPFIFDPFYRVSSSRRENGHGLGLSTVKNIVRSHDWTINVYSVIGKGTEFVIRICPVYSQIK